MIGTWPRVAITTVFASALFACGIEDDPVVTPPPTPANDDIELIGEWHSSFGGVDTITKTKWGASTIISADNSKNIAIVQSPADDPFTPSKFAKYVWTEPSGGRLFYCPIDLGRNTKEEAADTLMVADPTDPASGGCAGFPWTGYEPPLELTGVYTSSFQTTETIDSDAWMTVGAGYDLTVDIKSYDNTTNVAITQNPETDQFFPSKYNKVVWTNPAAGVFYYCTVDYGRDTLEQAGTSTQSADSTSPETGGCSSFPWTKLTHQ